MTTDILTWATTHNRAEPIKSAAPCLQGRERANPVPEFMQDSYNARNTFQEPTRPLPPTLPKIVAGWTIVAPIGPPKISHFCRFLPTFSRSQNLPKSTFVHFRKLPKISKIEPEASAQNPRFWNNSLHMILALPLGSVSLLFQKA